MKHPLFEESESNYFWCEHCERVYTALDWVNNSWCCPSGDCGGDALDAVPWLRSWLDRCGHSEYPDIPVVGGRYIFTR